ncbi:MAG: hypothetical protein WA671_11865, partial [Candidatus Sulfotelmatobacter sp.]
PLLSYVKDLGYSRSAMGNSMRFTKRTELLRRRKIKKSWTPARKAAHRARMLKQSQDPIWKRKVSDGVRVSNKNPEVLARRVAGLKRSNDDPEVLARRNAAIKKSWTRERKTVASARMSNLRTDPDFNRKLNAAIKRAAADPEERARRSDQLRKMNADPKVRARRKASLKIANADPEKRARQSLTQKKMWADLRAARSAQTAAAKPRNRRGRPGLEERNSSAAKLREAGMSYRNIARRLDPNFAKDPRTATEKVRSALRRMKRLGK